MAAAPKLLLPLGSLRPWRQPQSFSCRLAPSGHGGSTKASPAALLTPAMAAAPKLLLLLRLLRPWWQPQSFSCCLVLSGHGGSPKASPASSLPPATSGMLADATQARHASGPMAIRLQLPGVKTESNGHSTTKRVWLGSPSSIDDHGANRKDSQLNSWAGS